MKDVDSSPVILASSSPRRQEMLRNAGVVFTVQVSNIEEIPSAAETPEAMVRRLALGKASAIADKNPSAWVIGGDTDVSVDGEILGKPVDASDAARMLAKIQGLAHEVWGAFVILHRTKNISYIETHRTIVEMAPMSPEIIEWYVSTKEPLDKAGAYGAQNIGSQFIHRINGSYTNVVGLPLDAVMRALRSFGIA